MDDNLLLYQNYILWGLTCCLRLEKVFQVFHVLLHLCKSSYALGRHIGKWMLYHISYCIFLQCGFSCLGKNEKLRCFHIPNIQKCFLQCSLLYIHKGMPKKSNQWDCLLVSAFLWIWSAEIKNTSFSHFFTHTISLSNWI